ncbi:putative mfs monocarboxylate [Phaeomoniella chlamydospora]|uniref:Putative mfs monocarboxylate n=1 Tax=Phaeomoniella chlamydospora TaxID=158046 RepID=A0A0G2EQP4_PHACM|nr:putative mfs monocarboxylate [Phaeomoniella chlamydospora]
MEPSFVSDGIPPLVAAQKPEAALDNLPQRDDEARESMESAQYSTSIQEPAAPDVEDLPSESDIYPEGGFQAWLCVAGSFLFLLPSYGFMQTAGTVQSYLETHQLSHYTTRDVGWIPSIYTFLGLFLGIQIGPLFDRYGPRILGITGSVIYIAQFFLLAQCKVYWQFVLCLGILGGIGAAFHSTIAMAIVSNWFLRRRGLATGIAMGGSACGGVIFPILLRSLYPKLGFTWAMRVVAFIATGVLILGNLCIRTNPRLRQHHEPNNSSNTLTQTISPLTTSSTHHRPQQSTKPKPKSKGLISFSAFTSLPFTLITISLFALEFIIFGATGILPTYATYAGFPTNSGFNLIAIMNGASFFGRSLPGLAGDYFGHFNVLLLMIVFTLISMVAVWIPFGATNLIALYIFSALWGPIIINMNV